MFKYKFNEDSSGQFLCKVDTDGKLLSIPFDQDNTDYQRFKKDIAGGVEIQDADGNVLDTNEVKVLLRDLP